MATKNLSRTVIEGGRTGRNTWERRSSHTTERASERDYLNKISKDPEAYEEYDITEKVHVSKEFNDKLGPVYRWLERQVGRPWNEVRSEVSTTFDTRTTAGRHIVYDHLLSQVSTGPDYKYGRKYDPNETTSYFRYDFYVDAEGILCEKTHISRHSKTEKFDTARIANWLGGRVVGKVGNKLFWFVPADKNKKHFMSRRQWKCEWNGRNNYGYYDRFYGGLQWVYLTREPIYKLDGERRRIIVDGKPVIIDYQDKWTATSFLPNMRQDRKLNDKELAFWNKLPEFYQTKVLERSPTYPTPPKPDYGYYRF